MHLARLTKKGYDEEREGFSGSERPRARAQMPVKLPSGTLTYDVRTEGVRGIGQNVTSTDRLRE